MRSQAETPAGWPSKSVLGIQAKRVGKRNQDFLFENLLWQQKQKRLQKNGKIFF
jgi:hypothetical protein